jgi:AcrR family transcriptional regulator
VTTRRLADRIEHSQPVLYSHFDGKDAIVTAVALEGYGELATVFRSARQTAGSPDAEPRAVAYAYWEFERANPAAYEAMFALSVDPRFAHSDTPDPLSAIFVEIRDALVHCRKRTGVGDAQLYPFGMLMLSVLRLGVGHGNRSRRVSRGPSCAAIRE